MFTCRFFRQVIFYNSHFGGCDDSDGISTGGQDIVTIVIGNSRQMQGAFLAGSFKVVEDAVLVLEQRFLGIEESRESIC